MDSKRFNSESEMKGIILNKNCTTNTVRKGYKGTYNYCGINNFKFEIGKTYQIEETPVMAQTGFHFCLKPKNVLIHYPLSPSSCTL